MDKEYIERRADTFDDAILPELWCKDGRRC